MPGTLEEIRGLARRTKRRGTVSRVQLTSSSPKETERIAALVAAPLVAGDLVTVSGELGVGKTTFVRGAARALGVTTPVTSPTFTVGNRYRGSVDVSHLDLYRFEGVSSAEWGDLEPYFEAAICFVEWPEAGTSTLPPPRIDVRLRHVDRTHRVIVLSSPDRSLLDRIFADADARL
jgi:tRNA threonylcarbamoyladenosine biosynthesis protein TsaE